MGSKKYPSSLLRVRRDMLKSAGVGSGDMGHVVILLPIVILSSTQSAPVVSLAGWQRADILASKLHPLILTL